jgi:Putative prokaryotic signal transducing protein
VSEPVSEPLACPRCATRYPLEERFCARCGMPLTYAGEVGTEQPVSERQERARKIKPQYARGELRRVVTARQQAEAEWIQMLLLEEGIPSTLRRTAGFDVPEMLAAGPRDVLVPDSGLEAARELLLESEIPLPTPGGSSAGPSPLALLVGIGLALAVVALLAWAVASSL